MADEVREWTLTPQQRAELASRRVLKEGLHRLMIDIARAHGDTVLAERDWWDALCRYHQIPAGVRAQLVTDVEVGRVWVRGTNEDVPPGLKDNEARQMSQEKEGR